MGLFGTVSRFFNGARQLWQSLTGQTVPSAEVLATIDAYGSEANATLEGLTRQLYAGEISLSDWQRAVAEELKDAHLNVSMLARGGADNMGSAEYGRVGGTLKDEYRWLDRFANQIADGEVSEAQAQARIQQYGNATKQSYYREFDRATPPGEVLDWVLHPGENCPDCVEMANNSPYQPGELRIYPGSGHTRCRGRCKCSLERRAA